MGRDNRGGGFGRGDRRPGGRSFGNRGFGGGRDFARRETFQAICDSCGKECDVPFKPTQGKPVYCNDCFSKTKGRDSGRDRGGFGGRRPDNSGRDNNNADQLAAISSKLDKILQVLESNQPVLADSGVIISAPAKIKKSKVVKKATKKVGKKTAKKPAKKAAKKK
ncbi:MAG: CxxC-x17-CxxC domain-containing protein [Candidatus Komeilibacteria bacterium]